MSQIAECGVCHKEKECTPFTSNMMMCAECRQRQKDFEEEIIATQQDRLDAQEVIYAARKIDASIKIQSDIFNAKTVAIHKLKEAIDADESIQDKHFTLARALDERYKHLVDILFSKRAEITEGENEQRAIQTYYNELAKRLRNEQREEIRLKDAQYKPIEPVKILKPKAITVKKYDRAAINAAAIASGLPSQLIQMTCVQRNVTPVEAVKILQEAMNSVKGTANG